MPVARCPAVRRDGRSCGALASSPTATYCRRHEALAAELGDEAVRTGRYPRRRKALDETPLAVETLPMVTNGTAISPAEIRPRLAQVTAESAGQIEAALLDAALGATREHWTTFCCPSCNKKHRAQVAVPDVRSRIAATALLLEQGLGRVAQSTEPPAPRLPRSAEEVTTLGWHDLLGLGAAMELDAIENTLAHGGLDALRLRLGQLSEQQRGVLREALA